MRISLKNRLNESEPLVESTSPLPPPEILNCSDETTLVIYPLTIGQLAAPSVQYAKDVAALMEEASKASSGKPYLNDYLANLGPRQLILADSSGHIECIACGAAIPIS